MSLPGALRTRRDERGFVLVGVVMFILALTIIGLTLFDLSGYEAQFFERSVDEAQAYQLAMGGLDWAQWALTVQNDMRVVRTTPLPPGVTYVRARYAASHDSTASPISWSPGNVIEIRVQAEHHLARRLIEASYRPQTPRDYWKRLFTMSGGLDVVGNFSYGAGYPTTNRGIRTYITGGIWQNADTTQWWPVIPPWSRFRIPHPIRQATPVPALDLTDYFAQRWAGATPVAWVDAPGYTTYTLDPGSSTAVRWFRTAWDPGSGIAESIHNNGGEIHVTRGTAVWMLDRGLVSDHVWRVSGGSNAALVLVARPGPWSGGIAVRLDGGLETDGTPVYIASDGDVMIRHMSNQSSGSYVPPFTEGYTPYLSVYARNVFLMGPEDYNLRFDHDDDAHEDDPGGLVEDLYDAGALPLPSGAQMRGTLKLLAGSWREVKESDPD